MPLCVLLRVLKQGRRAEVSWAATARSEEDWLCTGVNFIDETRPVIVCDILATKWLSTLNFEEPRRHRNPISPLREATAGVTFEALQASVTEHMQLFVGNTGTTALILQPHMHLPVSARLAKYTNGVNFSHLG